MVGLIDEGVAAEIPLGRLSLDVQLLSHNGVVEVVKDGAAIDARGDHLLVMGLGLLQEGGVSLGSEPLTVRFVAFAEDVIFIYKSGLILELVEYGLAWSGEIGRVR